MGCGASTQNPEPVITLPAPTITKPARTRVESLTLTMEVYQKDLSPGSLLPPATLSS